MESTQTIHLPVYDTQLIGNELAKKSKDQQSFIDKLLSYLAKVLDEPTTTTTKILTHICESNLTANEILSRLAVIQDDEVRKKLDESVAPFLTTCNQEELALAFDMEFDFKDMNDGKGDLTICDSLNLSEASATNIKFNYTMFFLIRENDKYHLNLAYYHFNSSLLPESITALLRSKNEIKSDLSLVKLTAINKVHRLLQQGWPDRIQLDLLSTLPDEQ